MSQSTVFNPKLRLPVIVAPMFLVSGPKLVIESCKAGVVGTFPALNQRSTEGFEEWVTQIQKETINAAPFGVNLIVHKSNPRLEADLKICVKHKVPIVITSLGAVKEVVSAVHSYGGIVFHDVTNRRHAEKAAEAGVDGLIAVTAGAGGHAGTLNPFAFVDELRSFFTKTIILAGSISHGNQVLAARAAGADFAYMGTRFINTTESQAPDRYKQMIIESDAEDIVYTNSVSGVNANFMKQSLQEAGLYDSDKKGAVDFGKNLTVDQDEAKAWKNIWSAGHGVSGIGDILPVNELVNQLEAEYKAAQKRLGISQ